MWDVEGFKLFTKSGKAQPFKSLKVNTDRGEMLVGLNHVPFLIELDFTDIKFDQSRVEYLVSKVNLPNLKVLKISLLLVSCSHPENILKLLQLCAPNLEQVFYSVCFGPTVGDVVWQKILCHAFCFQVIENNALPWLYLYNSMTVPSLLHGRLFCCTNLVLINSCIGDEEM